MIVTHETIFGEVLEEYPETEEVLKEYLGAAYCLVCPGKMFDTIGNGILLHGLSDIDAKHMIEDLQAVVDSYEEGEAQSKDALKKDSADLNAATVAKPVSAAPTEAKSLAEMAAASGVTGGEGQPTKDQLQEWFPEIDTSAVNIDHMFDAARVELDEMDEEDLLDTDSKVAHKDLDVTDADADIEDQDELEDDIDADDEEDAIV